MAVVNNSLQLNDRMTPVLRSIMKALNSTLEAMASVDRVSSQGFRNAQRDAQRAAQAVGEFSSSVRTAGSQGQQSFDGIATSVRNAQNPVDGLIGKVKQLAAAYIGIESVKGIVALSDQMSSLNAATNIINEGQRHTLNLQEKIRQSALATGSNYMDVAANVKNLAMMAGNAFDSNDEILYFSEQLNKQFAIAGVQGAQASSVMYNLTQALSSGVLRGNDFNILASNMGNFIDGIAKTMGVTRDQMKKMAEEGKITADMVKKAMYDMSAETDKRFAQMPLQWGNIWNNMQTLMLQATEPLLTRISEIFNSAKFQAFIATATQMAVFLIGVLTNAFNIFASVGEFIYDKWLFIEPLLWSIGITGLSILIPTIWGMVTAAWAMVPPLWSAAAAWLALNWPVLAIGLAIGVVIALMKHFGVTSEDVIGRVVGAAYWMGQVFQNIWTALQQAFWTYISNYIKGIKWLLDKINIGGVFDDTISKLNDTSNNFAAKAAQKSTEYGSLSQAYDKGNKVGRSFATEMKSNSKTPGVTANNFARTAGSSVTPDKISQNTSKTAENTKKLTEGISLNDEDIELLKETARISFVNRFTTMTPNITATFGDVHETADVKGIMGQIERSVMDALESSLT